MANTDPYAPGTTRRQAESASEVDHFAQRLRALGATDDEVAAVVENWDELDADDYSPEPGEAEPWTEARRSALLVAGDAELRALIDASRDEYDYATTTDDEAAQADVARRALQAHNEAADVIGRPVAQVLEWVGGDRLRAQAALRLETGPDGGSRKTLTEQLGRLLDADAPAGNAEATAPQPASSPAVAAGPPAGVGTPAEAAAASPGPQGPAGGQPASS